MTEPESDLKKTLENIIMIARRCANDERAGKFSFLEIARLAQEALDRWIETRRADYGAK